MRCIRGFWIPILGIVITAIGVVLNAYTPPPSFGWSAYAPLTSVTFNPYPYSIQLIGLVLTIVGFSTVTAFLGFRAGWRHPDPSRVRRTWTLVAGAALLVVFVADLSYLFSISTFVPGESLVGIPTSHLETPRSQIIGLEVATQLRDPLLVLGLGGFAAWAGGAIARRRASGAERAGSI